jgi:hypothetical protein
MGPEAELCNSSLGVADLSHISAAYRNGLGFPHYSNKKTVTDFPKGLRNTRTLVA